MIFSIGRLTGRMPGKRLDSYAIWAVSSEGGESASMFSSPRALPHLRSRPFDSADIQPHRIQEPWRPEPKRFLPLPNRVIDLPPPGSDPVPTSDAVAGTVRRCFKRRTSGYPPAID